MREFAPTDRGEKLAQDAGLDVLAANLDAKDYFSSLVLLKLVEDGPILRYDEFEKARDSAIVHGYSQMRDDDSRREFVRGLEVEHNSSFWRHNRDSAEGRLFPTSSDYLPAGEYDNLIVSGVVGTELLEYRSRYPILSRKRYEEYGFNTYAESCAFVGGYVVHALSKKQSSLWLHGDAEPRYTRLDGFGLETGVFISGDLHGDFRMGRDKQLHEGAVDPIGRETLVAPREKLYVAGYHSVEPSITAAFIEYVLEHEGEEQAVRFIHELLYSIDQLSEELSYEVNPFPVRYADYGSASSSIYVLGGLRQLYERPHLRQERRGTTLLSEPYLPQSKLHFQMVQREDGILFRNQRINDEPMAEILDSLGILVAREDFPQFFRLLLIQAAYAEGRTSVGNHQLILEASERILQGEDMYEIIRSY